MTDFIIRRSFGCLLLFAFTVPALGCSRPAAAPEPAVEAAGEPASKEPGAIELSDPKATFTPPNMVEFEVHYRFTKGKPEKHYRCDVTFPGTENIGIRELMDWEMQPEGVIRDGITVSNPPVTKFEIRLSEADSPDAGYHLISNVASGTVK